MAGIPPKGLADAFEQAGDAVTYALSNLDVEAMRAAFGDDPRIGAWEDSKTVIRQLWAAAWSAWNLGDWARGGDLMQQALTEAGLLWREVESAKQNAMLSESFRILVNNTPLRFGEDARRGIAAAQNALADNGIPKPGLPTWLKLALGAALVVGVFAMVKK